MAPVLFSFDAVIESVEATGGAYVRVPFNIRALFGKGRLKVHAEFEGIPYDGSIVNMGIKHEDGSVCYIIGVRKDIRQQLGKSAGDDIHVTLYPLL